MGIQTTGVGVAVPALRTAFLSNRTLNQQLSLFLYYCIYYILSYFIMFYYILIDFIRLYRVPSGMFNRILRTV